jgi:tetrathionate reductase subunit B
LKKKEAEMSNTENTSRREALKTGAAAVATAVVTTGLLPVKAKAAASENPRWAMVVDLRKCTGCRACTIACKAEYGVALGRFNTVVKNVEFGKFRAALR